MSKNLTRKGLAFGALVALGSSVIAGAPAQAAGLDTGAVTLALNAGTSYNYTLGSTAVFTSNYASSLEIPGYRHKLLVEDASEKALVAVSTVDAATAVTAAATATNTFTTGVSKVTDGTAGNSALEYFAVTLPSTVTDSTTVKVTAWYDADNDGTIDGNEQASPTREIKFLKAADITYTTELVAPIIGGTTVSATVKANPELNGQQLATGTARGAVAVAFGEGAAAGTALAQGSIAFDPDSKTWTAVSAPVAAPDADIDAGDVYSAQAVQYTAAATVGLQGTKVFKTAVSASADADASTASIAASADVNPNAASTAATVRLTQKTVTYSVDVLKADETAVAANTAVVIGWTGSTASAVKINGTTVAKTTGTKTVYTDANGKISVTVNAATAEDTKDVILTHKVDGTNLETVTLTWAATKYTLYDLVARSDSANNNDYAALAGSTFAQEYRIVDQFGVALGSGYGLRVVAADRTVSNQVFAINNGVANVTVADGNVTGDFTTLTLTLVKADGASWTAHGLTGLTYDGTQTRVIRWASAATYTVTVGATSYSANVAAAEAKAADSRLNNVDPSTFTDGSVSSSDDELVVITGDVKNSVTGAVRAGTLVTVSGTGLLFNVGNVYAKDSITVRADDSGAYSVNVYSNKVVTDQVVTIAAEGATKTTKVSFVAALAAKTFTLDVPAFIGAGRAVDVVATLADKWGNKPGTGTVTVTFTSTGAGYLNSSSAITVDAAGKASVKLIVSVGETGTSTITATTANADIAATKREVSKIATIGAAPVAAAPAAAVAGLTGKVNLTVRNAANQGVVVTVNGKTVIARRATLAIQPYSVKTTAGKKTVVVKVAGKTVATRTVTVK